MKTADIVILESSDEFLDELKAFFDEKQEFNVCAVTSSGKDGIEYIERYKPDVVILNLVLSGRDGFSVLDYLHTQKPECKAIVISNFFDEKIVNTAIARGAKYYFAKPVEPQCVADRIEDLLNDKTPDYMIAPDIRDKRRSATLDEKISNIFISIGIPPHIKGYVYLREGIKMAVEDPSIINKVTKELYPNIGKKFDTSASKVERAIRHAIEVAWNRGRVDAINAIFGARVYIGNERPTNSEFIALVADKLLLEELL
ncbi:MAG: sporulation transcription factor Spo0A [Clostridia bacterium]|nr:sporulation transcription factor Spo0A [Clostridia bacterium]